MSYTLEKRVFFLYTYGLPKSSPSNEPSRISDRELQYGQIWKLTLRYFCFEFFLKVERLLTVFKLFGSLGRSTNSPFSESSSSFKSSYAVSSQLFHANSSLVTSN